jgi:hypothetical protein
MKQRRRDDGSVLPLVLVLIVIGSLVVLPVLDYTITVFRANRVVSDRTGQSEAAKAGLRVALSDPKNVFLTCDGGGNLTPSPNPSINGISVQTTCTEIGEVGPLDALGFAVPTGVAAMQLGATIPVDLSGTTASSPAVPPYPATPDWWATPAYVPPVPPAPGPAQYSPTAEDDKIWMPDLPRFPSAIRPQDPYQMPAAYDCNVFFPGRYVDEIDLSGRVYFTSGVYYFENLVTLKADADVVVGYGLEDFGSASDCADDLQVAANVLNPPTTFDINGGGATFVFGANGRFEVDNATIGTSAQIRFNQRYADADRGGRISIMTVNGDDVSGGPHVVTNVNSIPESFVLNGDVQQPLFGSGYTPSSSTYTDKARLPAAVDAFSAAELQEAGVAPDRGAALLTWDELTGNGAGGALLGEQDGLGGWTTAPYDVEYRTEPSGSWTSVCGPDELVISPKAVPTDGNTISCSVSGLTVGTQYGFRVRAVNEVGAGPWNGSTATPQASSPIVAAPDAPTVVQVTDGGSDDVAQVSWTPPVNNGGAPITGYEVAATKVALVPHANVAPVAPPTSAIASMVSPVKAAVPAFDPNGDDLALTINTTGFTADWTFAVDDANDIVEISVSALVLPGTYSLPYTVTDPGGETASESITITVPATPPTVNSPPVGEVLTLLADVGVPLDLHVPVSDPDGLPLAATDPIVINTTGFEPPEWTISVTGVDLSLTTTAPDGTYVLPYTVTDSAGDTTSSTIEVTVARDYTVADTCTVTTDPAYSTPSACEITLSDLTPVTPYGDVGYRFDVTAINEIGSSAVASTPAPYPLVFDGGGVGLLPPPERQVVPWVPEPIIDIEVGGSANVVVAIAGYVAVPMGRVHVDNPNSYDVRINGGVMAGTFDITDGRATGTAGSVPIGFKNDIVLQRKVRIVSVAKNVTSTAIVEVNEDGAGFAVNSWVVG